MHKENGEEKGRKTGEKGNQWGVLGTKKREKKKPCTAGGEDRRNAEKKEHHQTSKNREETKQTQGEEYEHQRKKTED